MKKKSLLIIILIIFIVAGPVVDLATGYFIQRYENSDLTPGVLYRGYFLLPIFFILTLRVKLWPRYFVLFCLAIFIVSLLLVSLSGHTIAINKSISLALKSLFAFFGLGALMFLKINYQVWFKERYLWMAGSYYGLLSVGSVIVFFLLGIANPTYSYQSFSSKAIFDSQNAQGIVIVLGLIFTQYYIHRYKQGNIFQNAGASGLYLIGAFLLSTRAVIIGVVSVILFQNLYQLLWLRKSSTSSQAAGRIIILFILLLIGYFIYAYWINQDVGYTLVKFNQLSNFYFRRRVPEGLAKITNFSLQEHLFGAGQGDFPLTENDLVDIYGKFGAIILVSIILVNLRFLIIELIRVIKHEDMRSFALSLCFIFYLGHASIAGHALLTAVVNNMMMIVLFLANEDTQGRKRSAAKTLSRFDIELGKMKHIAVDVN